MVKCYQYIVMLCLLQMLVGSSSLWAQWVGEGVPICTAANEQGNARLIPDGWGGAIIAWEDQRNGGYEEMDIFAQKIDAMGFVQWISNGVPICTAANEQLSVRIVSDGDRGTIIAWSDRRSSGDDWQIYMQRIDAGGNIIWEHDGIILYPEMVASSSVGLVADDAGGAIIAWSDFRNGQDHSDVFAQRIDANGNSLWTVNGVAICTAANGQGVVHMIPDGEGGAVITWKDSRWGGYRWIYTQKIDSLGTVQWTMDGVAIFSNIRLSSNIQSASDGSGGAIITWEYDHPDNNDIYVQRIAADGTVRWMPNGVPVCTATNSQWVPQIVTDGAGEAIIAWHDERNGTYNYDVYIQRVDPNGIAQWTHNGVAVCTEAEAQTYPKLIATESGGVIITWYDKRDGDPYIYAQRLDASGNNYWETAGIKICDEAGGQWHPSLIPDDNGGAIISWIDIRNGNEDIYAQRLDQYGNAPPSLIAIQCPNDTTIPAFTNDPLVPLTGFRITNVATVNLSFDYHLTTEGPATLVDNGDPASISGTTPILAPDESYSPPEPALELVVLRGYAEEKVTHYVSAVELSGVVDSCITIISFEPPIATLLRSYAASYIESSVIVSWTLSETCKDMQFFIGRVEETGRSYEEIYSPDIEKRGLTLIFRDDTCLPGNTYRYRVDVADEEGTRILFETEAVTVPVPPLTLYQNVPNPFNPVTTIKYYVPARTYVTLNVYDAGGRLIAGLVDRVQEVGQHEVKWTGSDTAGNTVSSGVYFYRLTAGKRSISKKMVLLR